MVKPFILSVFLLLLLGSCNGGGGTDFDRLRANDQPMQPPQEGDWRSAHPEPDQSVSEYIRSSPVRSTGQRRYLYVTTLGTLSRSQDSLVATTVAYLSVFFGKEVRRLPANEGWVMPAVHRRIGARGQEQWHTRYLLDTLLKAALPADAVGLLALTPTDLYPDPKWNFVFGQASLQDRVSVTSLFRYNDGTGTEAARRATLLRLLKVAAHELGHMFSLHHCLAAQCVMNGGNSRPELDAQPERLCSRCLEKLQYNIGFNLRYRLVALDTFFAAQRLEAERRRNRRDIEALAP